MADTSDVDWPLIMQAIQRQNDIDQHEAGPKAPYSRVEYKGAIIESRWSVVREFREMRAIMDQIPDIIAYRVSWIWCDSKCTNNFSVGIKDGLFAPEVATSIEQAIVEIVGGHNGLVIQYGDAPFCGKELASLDPLWPGYELDDIDV